MSEIKVIDNGTKFTHASAGNLNAFQGKQFVKDAIGATSCELSLGSLPTGATVPFFHNHKTNEEIYIILSGAGKFQVDDNVFAIETGSIVRVATGCDRNIKCTSTETMVYICLQAKENSLALYTMTDAEVTERDNLL